MPRLTLEQRIKVIEWWHVTHSVVQIQRNYCAHFQVRNAPVRKTIVNIVQKFSNVGTVKDLHKGQSGRRRSSRCQENIETVRESIIRSPRKSIRRLSQETGIPKTSVNRILRSDLNAFPYKIQSQKELTQQQKAKRLDFARWFSGRLENDAEFLQKIHMTDECHAHLSGKINKQNFRYWGTQAPNEEAIEETTRSALKTTVWVAIGWYGIIGPYFFEDQNGNTVTVNQINYREMIENFYLPELRGLSRRRNNNVRLRTQWFQQDGAPPHTANETRNLLRRHFPQRFISLHEDVEWPPYSPDLTPPDFFLWGYLKDRIYANPKPENLNQLKENIRREIRNINAQVFPRVMQNVAARLQKVIGLRGGYIDHIL